ncbi:MAG: glutathione S-transferase family protein [Actinomycetia bacterium]|nr:glutathione S-transferase family protein [Actinomycetes bacterium]
MTADVALYGHWICPFATRVQFALHQRRIAHELIDLPPSAVRGPDFELPPEFIEHSPQGEIPMLRIGDRYLADSIPILEWMESEVPDQPLLPLDETARALVRERMAWIDRSAFRPMVGVYYGTEPDRIARAGEKLADALAQMGKWTEETGWLAGPDVSLAEAVAMPIHVRMAGLERLGYSADISPSFAAHGERCRSLHGWAAVAWSAEQCDEFVGRFAAYRRERRD